MKNRTVKQLKAIADRIGMPYRKNERKLAIQQEIISFLNFPRIWKAIAGTNNS